MLIVAQTMVLTCAACGLVMFLYIHLFTFRRLRHQERRFDRDEARADRELGAAAEPGTQLAVAGMMPAQTEAAMFYLYQEQVRRFIDAKIDIMRNAAETQNRIMVIQAETLRNTASRPALQTIDIDLDGSQIADGPTMLPARREEAFPLSDQLRAARAETERHLAEIDQQIRSLPGPSLNQWVNALDER
ncbi:MAG: hypothetical protein WCO00_15260 [Rhodospirillaceae bacterium]